MPTVSASDIMHQPLLNLATLLLNLWCAQPNTCDHNRASVWPWAMLGDTWKNHGKFISSTAKYLPTLFGQMPQNPQKISSGYKAWELLNHIYGEGPGIFYAVLPDVYYFISVGSSRLSGSLTNTQSHKNSWILHMNFSFSENKRESPIKGSWKQPSVIRAKGH